MTRTTGIIADRGYHHVTMPSRVPGTFSFGSDYSEEMLPLQPIEVRKALPEMLRPVHLARFASFKTGSAGKSEKQRQAESEKKRKDLEARLAASFALAEAGEESTEARDAGLLLAWRVTRELARHLGLVSEDETLLDTVPPEAWMNPNKQKAGFGGATGVSLLCSDVMRAIADAARLSSPGIPLMPPSSIEEPVLSRQHEDCWNAAVLGLIHWLRIPHGTLTNPVLGLAGMKWIFELGGWPSIEEILAFEMLLIEEVANKITGGPRAKVQSTLFGRLGLSTRESVGLTAIARRHLVANLGSVEEEKALLAAKLEEFVDRARRGLDLRAELGALKTLGVVLGVTRAEPEDDIRNFARNAADEPPPVTERPEIPEEFRRPRLDP